MDIQEILGRVEKEVEPVLENLGLWLVEREFASQHGHWVLRLYIDRENATVTLADCATASRALEGVLDVASVIAVPYHLEVSSPGLDRPLRYVRDFERFRGSKIEIAVRAVMQGRSHFSGTLIGLQNGEIILQEGHQEYQIPMNNLKKARMKYEGERSKNESNKDNKTQNKK